MTMGIPGPTGKPRSVKGTGYKALTMQDFTPEQMALFRQMFGQVGPESFLSRLAGGSPEQFEQMEAPALRQFAGIQGNLASRFSGMGSGARRSSGFGNAMNTTAQEFAERLQANRMDLQRQAIRDLADISGSLLQQRPYQTAFLNKKQPFWKELLAGMSQGIGQGIGQLPMALMG